MGAAGSIRQPLISKQLPLQPAPVWMASVTRGQHARDAQCAHWELLEPTQGLAQASSAITEVTAELLTALPTQNEVRILRLLANAVS